MIKKYLSILSILMISLLILTACVQENTLTSSSDYPMQRAIINTFQKNTLDVKVQEWKQINDNLIYIITQDNKEFIVDTGNVTFLKIN